MGRLMFDINELFKRQIAARDAARRAQANAAVAAARAAAGRAAAYSKPKPSRPTWTLWTIQNGIWYGRKMNGTAPRQGRKRAWADEVVGYDANGKPLLQRTAHWVYPNLNADGTPRTSAAPAVKAGTGTAQAAKKKVGRPLYEQRERYFNANTGKWAWRTRYIPTNAEVQARKAGLKHDDRGYYRSVGGHRQYVTGRVGDRRFHMEGQGDNRHRVWDDPSRWPWEVSRRRQRLKDRRQELRNRLDSLKDQYKRARKDQHILRRNIVRRMNETERSLDRVTNALKRLPTTTAFALKSTEKKYRGAMSVVLDFAIEPEESSDPLAFQTGLRVKRNANVWVRATITMLDRDWKPGRLAAPHMIRTKWTWPKGWLKMDDVGLATDEYMVSNPLQVIRRFRSPGTGDRTPTFTCKAYVYEWSFGNPGGVQHKAGFG